MFQGKIVSIFILTISLLYGCSFKSYRTRESIEPKFIGKEIVHPEYRQNGMLLTEYEGLQVTEFKSGLKEYTVYHLGAIIDSYFIENGDTINRVKHGRKEGFWHEYIPCVKHLLVEYYVHDEMKYSYIVYLGKPITIDLYDDTLKLLPNNKICFGIKDSAYHYLNGNLNSKHNIKYIELTKKNQYSFITYEPTDSSNSFVELGFYKRNRLAYKACQTDSQYSIEVIYDKNGNIIYQLSDGEINLDATNPKVRQFFRNDDRINNAIFSYRDWSCDFQSPIRISIKGKRK